MFRGDVIQALYMLLGYFSAMVSAAAVDLAIGVH